VGGGGVVFVDEKPHLSTASSARGGGFSTTVTSSSSSSRQPLKTRGGGAVTAAARTLETQQHKGRSGSLMDEVDERRLDDDESADDDSTDHPEIEATSAPRRPSLKPRKSIHEVLKAMGKSEADVGAIDLDPPRRFSDESLLREGTGAPRAPKVSYQISSNYIAAPAVAAAAPPTDAKDDDDCDDVKAAGHRGTTGANSRRRHLGDDLAEQSIQVVLAKRFAPSRDAPSPGFPAFDAHKRLVGFYHEESSDNSTHIVFVRADDPAVRLDHKDWERATDAYEKEIQSKSDCVFTLARYENLERLKEECAIYFWCGGGSQIC